MVKQSGRSMQPGRHQYGVGGYFMDAANKLPCRAIAWGERDELEEAEETIAPNPRVRDTRYHCNRQQYIKYQVD